MNVSGVIFSPLEPKKQRSQKKNNAWSQVSWNLDNVASFKAFRAVFSLECMMLHSNMIQETSVDTWPIVLKINLLSFGVAFLLFFFDILAPFLAHFNKKNMFPEIMWKMNSERRLPDNTRKKRKTIILLSLRFILSLQSAFCILYLVYIFV